MIMSKRAITLSGVVVVLGLLGGVVYLQGFQTTPLSKILANPKAYDGKAVLVRGEVKQEASLLGYGGYLLADGEAQIVVVTKTTPPPLGAAVKVRGIVEEVASFLGKRVVILRESAPEKGPG